MIEHAPDTPELNRIKKVLSKYSTTIQLAIVFGSVATGKADFDSDLDLAVDFGRPMEQHEKIQLISELAEVLGRPVDLIDLRTAGLPLLKQILAKGKRILGNNAGYALTLYKYLIDQADFMPYRNRILRERREKWLGM